MTSIFVCNYDPSKIIEDKTVHISYRTERSGNEIHLYEIVEIFIQHPEAGNEILLQDIVTRFVKTEKIGSKTSGTIEVFDAIHRSLNNELNKK